MDVLADYPPPEQGIVITGTDRIVCYNQTINDDSCVEGVEFFSLTLTVQDGSALTTVDARLSSAVIMIVDDDGELETHAVQMEDESTLEIKIIESVQK